MADDNGEATVDGKTKGEADPSVSPTKKYKTEENAAE